MSSTAIDGVLIVGGGYAGVHAARAAREKGVRATIVSATDRHDFVTRLAGVAGGASPVSDASAPLEGFADEVIVGRLTQVTDGEVTLEDGRQLAADAVVITAGAVPVRPPIEGIDHALPLRTAGDARKIRAAVEEVESVVVIGGGATGVQLAGAIAHAHRATSVTVLDGATSLLENMGRWIGRDAGRILRRRGVTVELGHRVEVISPDGVVANGVEFDGLPLWAAGFQARADTFGLRTDATGRAVVDAELRADGMTSTFVAGDIAAHTDRTGDALSMSAQIAVQAGDVVGANAARLIRGRSLRSARLDHRGWVLDLAGGQGVAEVGPIELSMPFIDMFPPLLHWGVDVKHLLETKGLRGLDDLPGG